MFSLPGHGEWIIIILIVLILFGGKKIPELARGLGKGIKEFKEGMKPEQEKPKELDDKKKDEDKA
ncbi:twin-arginine translocase TatA/TatE family subunit [bacterium]|nr:twin-arginine translocase TatA/TatE family subunit [bacterium]